jgi:hypothetical protein
MRPMFETLQVAAVMIAAVPAALSFAHALELPGKLRLDEPTYRAVQQIYYPGFTLGGMAEIPSVLVTALLLYLTAPGTAAFWLVLAALLGLAGMNAVYWLIVHPVNKHWVGGALSAQAASFFGRAAPSASTADWTALRDRWERGHLMRAALAGLSLLALVISLVV